jgi:uncharacterized protein
MSKRQGISPQVPLVYDYVDGPYRLNKTIGETLRQNFKNLILTGPGERIMEPQFGVGLHRYLFEHMDGDVMGDLVSKIKEQTGIYLPSINLTAIDFITSDEEPTLSANQITVVITYNILPNNTQDQLQITSTMTS